MFENFLSPGMSASLEIIIILSGMFFFGFVLAWLIKPLVAKEGMYVVDDSTDSKEVLKDKLSKEKSVEIEKQGDDLTLIEGITPRVVGLLSKNNIVSYKDIYSAGVVKLEEILQEGGKYYAKLSPTTWPDQAKLADKKKWHELEEYQEIMKKNKTF